MRRAVWNHRALARRLGAPSYRLHQAVCSSVAQKERQQASADLVLWPDGLRPKSGRVTKTALNKLKVADLKSELSRRDIAPKGTKIILVDRLLEVVLSEWESQECSSERNGVDEGGSESQTETVVGPSHTSLTEMEGRQEEVDDAEQSPGLPSTSSGGYSNPGHKMYVLDSIDNGIADVCFGGKNLDVDDSSEEAKMDFLQANRGGMQFIFLGTSSWAAAPDRGLPSMAFRTQADTWLFDVGEDTQRQILKHPVLRPGKITRLFITGISAELILGIPGMICTIGCSRERGHSVADIPLHIYGPPGLAEFIESFLDVSQTYVEIPIIVHEFTMNPVPDKYKLRRLNARCKLWKALITPDALNAEGFYDAGLRSVMPINRRIGIKTGKRHRRNLPDDRAFFRTPELPKPGDPSGPAVSLASAVWTLRLSNEFTITVMPLKASNPSLAYYIKEAGRAGNLDIDRAHRLGLTNRKFYGALKRGDPVENEHGHYVDPKYVVSPDRKGRRVLIMGNTTDPMRTVQKERVESPDLVVMPLTYPHPEEENSSVEKDMMLPGEAAGFGEEIGAKRMLFNRIEESEVTSGTLEERCLHHNEAFDLYTHVLLPEEPESFPPLTDELIRDMGCSP
ncbi:hypothetical protein BSKO_01131 [Bryopsis sp. KO-2023]|nr:hypothetical protein BSKO_01131 [Bryopsis sp. KO-2023]